MTTQTLYFSGPCKWAKLREPDDYNGEKKWKIDLYLNRAELKNFKDSGLKLKIKEDEEGNKFVTFNRPITKEIKGEMQDFEPPKLFTKDHEPLGEDVLIGNGSEVTVKIETYDTTMGRGHRLKAVRVDNLVEYVKPETNTSDSNF